MMNKKRFILMGVVLLSMSSKSLIAQGTQEVAFIETRNLDFESYRGHASIAVGTSTLKLGEGYKVLIQFFNDGGSNHFFNPDFNGLIPIPVCPVIYDINKKYIGDLWRWEGGSRRGVEGGDWKLVPAGSHVDYNWSFIAGCVPGSYDGGQHLLPAGEYYLQVIYFKAFIGPNPFSSIFGNPPVDITAFYKNFDRGELFRSNAIKVRFVAASAVTPTPQP
jgi:hypothetical protein